MNIDEAAASEFMSENIVSIFKTGLKILEFPFKV